MNGRAANGRTVKACLLLAALALAGCTAAPLPPPEPVVKVRTLSSYSTDPFVPINLYLNPNEYGSKTLAEVTQYAADRLRDSGAFVRVDQGVQRWPITLQARYQVQEFAGEGDGARRVVRWLTLGLMPVRTTQRHTLRAEVLVEPDSVASLELTVTVQDEATAWRAGSGGHAGADALLERLVHEIANRKLIPRWATFKPELKETPNPAKPVGGQPT